MSRVHRDEDLKNWSCPIEASPGEAEEIAVLIASGVTVRNQIALRLKAAGRHRTPEAISRHIRICLGGVLPTMNAAMVGRVTSGEVAVAPKGSDIERDFAVALRNSALDLLTKGDLRVTASHGLTAQALIDRRAEKEADRGLAINLARLLSGAVIDPPQNVIEGRIVRDVTPADAMLAPVSVVGDE